MFVVYSIKTHTFEKSLRVVNKSLLRLSQQELLNLLHFAVAYLSPLLQHSPVFGEPLPQDGVDLSPNILELLGIIRLGRVELTAVSAVGAIGIQSRHPFWAAGQQGSMFPWVFIAIDEDDVRHLEIESAVSRVGLSDPW